MSNAFDSGTTPRPGDAGAGARVAPIDLGAVRIETPVILAPMSGVTDLPYRRLARVEGSFAIVNAAAVVRPGGRSTVAIGGIAGSPIVVDATAAVAAELSGDALAGFDDAVRAACGEPFEDLNGDAEYRREMAVVHARRALRAAAGSAG